MCLEHFYFPKVIAITQSRVAERGKSFFRWMAFAQRYGSRKITLTKRKSVLKAEISVHYTGKKQV